MTARIALLRAVNVGGTGKIGMAALREFFGALDLGHARTLLQSGNVVFDSAAMPRDLEARLRREAEKRLGLNTEFFVRTAAEWKAIVAANPFPDAARADPGHLLVMFLNDAPGPALVKALQGAIVGRERVAAKGRQAYLVYPDGIGRSRLTGAVIERHLQTRGTARNWNTVRKLAVLAGVGEGELR